MGRAYDEREWLESADVIAPRFAGERRRLGRDLASSEFGALLGDEQYRYTVALSPLTAWIADLGGGMLDIDERGLQTTGLTYDECMGAGFLSAIHSTDRHVVKAAWARARVTGLPLDYEMRLRQADGSFRWQRCRAAPRRTRGGEILCWYGTIEDIEDRKKADLEVRWSADHDDLTGLWNRRAL